jgi:hypothetical protein
MVMEGQTGTSEKTTPSLSYSNQYEALDDKIATAFINYLDYLPFIIPFRELRIIRCWQEFMLGT